MDIFTFADTDYLMTVDYLSGWFELDRLGTKTASNIVYCLVNTSPDTDWRKAEVANVLPHRASIPSLGPVSYAAPPTFICDNYA